MCTLQQSSFFLPGIVLPLPCLFRNFVELFLSEIVERDVEVWTGYIPACLDTWPTEQLLKPLRDLRELRDGRESREVCGKHVSGMEGWDVWLTHCVQQPMARLRYPRQ